MKIHIFTAVLCAVTVQVFAQDQLFRGECPVVRNDPGFEEGKFIGDWIEVSRYKNSILSGGCVKATYKLSDGTFSAKYTEKRSGENSTRTHQFDLKKTLFAENGTYTVTIDGTPQNVPHRIIMTDYTKYAVVWGCSYYATNRNNIQRLSILARSTSFGANEVLEVFNKLNGTGLPIFINASETISHDSKTCSAPTVMGQISMLFFAVLLIVYYN